MNIGNFPLVSIYITNHNYGKYIEKSVNSVLNQTYKNFEIIIIDDGSTDNSRKIIKKFSKNKKIKIIYQKEMIIKFYLQLIHLNPESLVNLVKH